MNPNNAEISFLEKHVSFLPELLFLLQYLSRVSDLVSSGGCKGNASPRFMTLPPSPSCWGRQLDAVEL